MTLRDKIEELQAAYEVLLPYVDHQRYYDYLQGLLDAQDLAVGENKASHSDMAQREAAQRHEALRAIAAEWERR